MSLRFTILSALIMSLSLASMAEARGFRLGFGRGYGRGFGRAYASPVFARPLYRPTIAPGYGYGYGGGYGYGYNSFRRQRRVRNTLLGVGIANELFNRGRSRRVIRGAAVGGLLLNGIFR